MQEKIYVSNGNIMYIYRIMKKYTDIEHPLKIEEIIKLIKKEYGEQVSNRTVRRNFKVLENKFNIIIERVDDGYYMEYEDYDFDSSEIRCMVDMVNYSRFVDEKLARQLTYKLVNQLNENDKKEFLGYEKYMKDTKTTNKELFYTVKLIAEAILNKKYIQFDYYKYNINKEYEFRKAFAIFPITIICDIGQYYMVAADKDKNLFYFRLDRIKNIELVEGTPISISKKQLDNYIHSTVGMYGGEQETVKAIVSNRLIDDVIDVFGRDSKIEKYDDQSFIMETKANLVGFKNWVLRHLENVRVVYPQKLKNEIMQILSDAVNSYKSK